METAATPPRPSKLARIGDILSLSCAVHCALSPLFLAVVPVAALSASPLAHEVESWVVITSLLLCAFGLWTGYRRHRRPDAWQLFAAALVLVAVGHHWHQQPLGIGLSVVGMLLLLPANLLNHRHSHRCTCPGHHHDHGGLLDPSQAAQEPPSAHDPASH